MNPESSTAFHSSTGWRFNLGIAIVGLILLSWLLIPLTAVLGVPGTAIAALTGVLFIGNKVLLILVIGIMGKSGFQELKRRVFGYLKIMTPQVREEVSPLRHGIGLVMFCVPLISAFLEPYIDMFWPGLRPNLWQLQLLGDLMLVGSVFVLGGNFWGKVRALFIRTARTVSSETV